MDRVTATSCATNAANELAHVACRRPDGTGDPDVLDHRRPERVRDGGSCLRHHAAGYTNLVPAFGGDNAYSFVFDGQWGSLDHALANDSLASQITAAGDWFINADEPSVLDYNTNFKSAGQLVTLYAADEFRVADHNPVVIDLSLTTTTTIPGA